MNLHQRIAPRFHEVIDQLTSRVNHRAHPGRRTSWATGALALALAASAVLAPTAALALPVDTGTTAPKPTGNGPLAPVERLADLDPLLYISNATVDVNQPLYVSVTVQNKGDATAGPSQTRMMVHGDMKDVHIAFQSPGTNCTIQSGPGIPGYAVTCFHGSIGPGGSAVFRVNATPTEGGLYGFPTNADFSKTVAESNEENNSDSIALNVRKRIPY